ncbi:MAG: glycerate kinase type-2 family protein [Beijerinckiaceae bacterium]
MPATPSAAAAFAIVEQAYRACVAAVHPSECLAPFLARLPAARRVIVVGAGKASAAMAQAFERHYPGEVEGVVLTRYDHAEMTRRITIREAAHPVPDEAGVEATEELVALLKTAGPDDLVVGLVSGGGSALLCAPVEGLTLADKQEVNRALLASGMPIQEMNVVRKHLSRVKGGKLPSFAPQSRFISFLMSDVPGDDLAAIASGPTVGAAIKDDPLELLARYGITPSPQVRAALADPANRPLAADDPRLARTENVLVASPAIAFARARDIFAEAGFAVEYLGSDLEGEASVLGREHAAMALSRRSAGRPLCILSGGETTVTVKGHGEGGRNTEYLLGLTLGLAGAEGIHAFAADTDGIDGKGVHAGAFASPRTLAMARAAGVDPEAALARNDSLAVFRAAGGVYAPGATRTNVNDFRAILISP